MSVVVGSQYPRTADVVPLYGFAALSNALLSLWIAYFIGRGAMRVGLLLALAVIAEVTLLLTGVSDAVSMARIVLGVTLAMQLAAAVTFVVLRSRR